MLRTTTLVFILTRSLGSSTSVVPYVDFLHSSENERTEEIRTHKTEYKKMLGAVVLILKPTFGRTGRCIKGASTKRTVYFVS